MLKLYTIPKFKLEIFNKRITKISNKASRLGLAEYKVEYLKEEIVEIKGSNDTVYNIPFVTIQVEGEAPYIEGYKIIAMLEQLNGENIVKRFDRESESHITTESLAKRDTSCEHCNHKRSRKYIFILESENGELVQVGKSCLKDFTNCNYSAESIAKYYEDTDVLYELENVEEDDFANYGSSISVFKLDNVLVASMYFTIKEGYKPSSFDVSTKSEVCSYLSNTRKADYEDAPTVNELLEAHDSTLEQVKEFFANQKATSDYIHNLQVILNSEYIEYKHIGYAVSAFSSYLKHFEREIKKQSNEKKETVTEALKKDSQYVGEVGQRTEFGLLFDRVVSYESLYGVGYMYFFTDNEGNVFLWGTNKHLEFEKNESVQMVGTIKEHKEYRDVKQTVITRCKTK